MGGDELETMGSENQTSMIQYAGRDASSFETAATSEEDIISKEISLENEREVSQLNISNVFYVIFVFS